MTRTRRKGGGAYRPPLDGLSDIHAAWSVRKLLTSYTGPCMTVRRSSDNAEADIGFGSDGWLDEAALIAHCGANSGLIKQMYDQSGNARHVSSANGTQQPRIVLSGVIEKQNDRPAVRPDGIDDILARASAAWPGADMTLFVVESIPGVSQNQNVLRWGAGSTAGIDIYLNAAAAFADWFGDDGVAVGNGYNVGRNPRVVLNAPNFRDSTLHAHAIKMAAAGSTWLTDTVAKTTRTVGSGAVPAVTATLTFDAGARSGYWCERILFAADHPLAALQANQKAAFSTP